MPSCKNQPRVTVFSAVISFAWHKHIFKYRIKLPLLSQKDFLIYSAVTLNWTSKQANKCCSVGKWKTRFQECMCFTCLSNSKMLSCERYWNQYLFLARTYPDTFSKEQNLCVWSGHPVTIWAPINLKRKHADNLMWHFKGHSGTLVRNWPWGNFSLCQNNVFSFKETAHPRRF